MNTIDGRNDTMATYRRDTEIFVNARANVLFLKMQTLIFIN